MTTTTNPRTESFMDLVGDLQTDIKTLIKKEMELAKTEMSEKFKGLGRNAGFAAGGGILALIAFCLLLLGIGAILARVLQNAGLDPGTAYFVSFAGLSLVLGGVGYALIHKAMVAFSKLSLSPEKTLETVRGPEAPATEIHKPAPKRSSDEVHTEVVAARARMEDEIAELKERLTPGYLLKSSMAGAKHHPLRLLLFGVSTGLGGYLIWRKQHMAEVRRLQTQRKWWQVKLHHA